MPAARPEDVVVIGAGLIGLSTGMQLLERFPRLRVTIIEKDAELASQQSGHNSGVIHSGIYYKPGSFKARFAVEGRSSMLAFCRNHGVTTSVCGKLVVATEESEVPGLRTLFERGTENGVEGLKLLSPDEAREVEPNVRAVAALHVPGTAIVDFRQVAAIYADTFRSSGGTLRLNSRLLHVGRGGLETTLETDSGDLRTRAIVNCAGLHSDVVARMAGARPRLRIIPFRGEYYVLKPGRSSLVKGLIYPVPDPRFPFLGVHLTRTVRGTVEAGPNAVLATKREGYRRRDLAFGDVLGMLSYPGFWRLARREWRTAIHEVHRSLRKTVFLASLQRLMPTLTSGDLDAGGAGVRAQAVAHDGRLLDDFSIERSPNAIHVLNAPSPGATSSLVIGRHIVDLVEELQLTRS